MSRSVDRIKSKLSIVDIVGSYVTLKKAGIHHKGLCPFHNEKSPSFTVSEERNSYYCFGCGAKGDIFSFIEEYEGVDFKQALSMLAEKAGVDLSEDSFVPEKKIDKGLYGVLELSADYYASLLRSDTPALDYLKNRGIIPETISSWNIGYARDEWRGVYDFLLSKGINAKQMLDVGLIKKKEGKDGYYDVFRGRIMFPIKDILGRVVGFSGRILIANENSPKYLNTPETPLFNKSEVLFGLEKAKHAIRKLDYVVVVEGQMDVVMSHQSGIRNAVASSGTAFTSEHLSKISPLTKRIVFSFDGDKAGLGAMKRSGLLSLKSGFDVKVLSMEDGKDPADLVKENPENWIATLKKSKPIIDFLLASIGNESLDVRAKLKRVSLEIMPFVASIQSSIEQAHYIKKISEMFSISESAVWDEMKKEHIAKQDSPDRIIKKNDEPTSQIMKGGERRERLLAGLLFLLEEKNSHDVLDPIKKEIIRIRGEDEYNSLREKYDSEKEGLMFESESLFMNEDDKKTKELIESVVQTYELDYLERELQDIKREIKFAEQNGDGTKATELLKTYNTKMEYRQNISSRLLSNEKN